MQAVIVKKYGGPEVAIVSEVPKPIITKPNQLLIKVMVSSVNSGDARLRRADPWFVRLIFGFTGPRKRILGAVFAGVVEAVGTGVATYRVGDRVYGMPESFMGGHAEYIVVSDTTPMGTLADTMNFIEAAALPFGGTTALHFLTGLELAGKSVLINGASGAVGVCFVQLAKLQGAMVTAVTSSNNLSLMESLGASETLDYAETDILTRGATYDVVIDCVNKIPVPKIETLVAPGGAAILLSGLIKEMWQSRKLKKAKVIIGTAKVTSAQFVELNQLFVSGALRPVVDHVFPLTEIASAYRLVDSGRKVGSVVLQIDPAA